MSSLAVFEARIRMKSMHLIKSFLKTKKRENMEMANKDDYIAGLFFRMAQK